jgi:hypothetical protein
VKISKRETILGLATLTTVLFGLTFWMSGSRFEEQRELKAKKARMLHEIELNKRILNEKDAWYKRLEELQAQLPVYDTKVSISSELVTVIRLTAENRQLNLVRTQSTPEKQTGSLYETGISCSWEGTLDSLVKFLYDLQQQGGRFDVPQITAQPDAQRDRILKGTLTINCAYLKNTQAAP